MFSYIYYTIYKFVLITPSKDELPQHIANTILTIILCFNLFALMHVFQNNDIQIGNIFFKEDIYIIIFFLIFLAIGYFFFVRKEKYLRIAKKYDLQSKKSTIIKMSLVGLYVILSFVLPFILGS